ncbi:MAG: sigma-54-dependent Fis family transcriptional regulator [Candidatus Wallbacteria bacterium]|nr:sigma-54-dependent Fis family transcriptional regulator [Candidatus Wallbacteria bacterium]
MDDEDLIRWSLERDLSRQGYAVTTAASGAEALRMHESDPTDVVLLDINLPDGSGVPLIPKFHAIREDCVIIMITSDTGLDSAVQSVRNGAWDYVTKPFDFPKLYNSVAKAVEQVSLRQENRTLRSRDRAACPSEIVAESDAMRKAMELASHVMASDTATVLLRGESGVGKDLLARHIHAGSSRAERLFLDINCAALPETLLESELFGHERGAFTDARAAKQGLFELAAGGTVYLDEVADAPLAVQAKLLKVLEQRTFRRLGGVRDLVADIRLIAATNRDLERAIAERVLREDLYYRLKVFPIHLPPLRERHEDILILARTFVSDFGASLRKRVPGLEPETERRFLEYRWPGNVRELRNVIERAMILARPDTAIGLELLPPEICEEAPSTGPAAEPGGALAQTEARMIRDALGCSGGNQSQAAAHLGISRGVLARRMQRLGIAVESDED